jgi:hypothetical protein
MGEVVQNNQLWHHAKFEHFWISGWEQIRITKFEQLEKKDCTELGPAQCYSTDRGRFQTVPEPSDRTLLR